MNKSILPITLILLTAGCICCSTSTPKQKLDSAHISLDYRSFTEQSKWDGKVWMYIDGSIKNNGDYPAYNILVKCKAYDSFNNVVDTKYASLTGEGKHLYPNEGRVFARNPYLPYFDYDGTKIAKVNCTYCYTDAPDDINWN